jgi:hypothetical protein
MHGMGTISQANGETIRGTWVEGLLHGPGTVWHFLDNEPQECNWSNGVRISKVKAKERQTDREWLNIGLTLAAVASAATGIYKKKKTWAVAAGCAYALQLVESLTSNTFSYINNIKTEEET